jgi:Uncharacterized protein conserved in archaea
MYLKCRESTCECSCCRTPEVFANVAPLFLPHHQAQPTQGIGPSRRGQPLKPPKWHLRWVVWSAVTYWIETSLFEGKADLGEMLRVVGFAQAPLILAIIPCLGWLVGGI